MRRRPRTRNVESTLILRPATPPPPARPRTVQVSVSDRLLMRYRTLRVPDGLHVSTITDKLAEIFGLKPTSVGVLIDPDMRTHVLEIDTAYWAQKAFGERPHQLHSFNHFLRAHGASLGRLAFDKVRLIPAPELPKTMAVERTEGPNDMPTGEFVEALVEPVVVHCGHRAPVSNTRPHGNRGSTPRGAPVREGAGRGANRARDLVSSR